MATLASSVPAVATFWMPCRKSSAHPSPMCACERLISWLMHSVGLTAPANAVGLSGECQPAPRHVLPLRGSRDEVTRSRRTGVDSNERTHACGSRKDGLPPYRRGRTTNSTAGISQSPVLATGAIYILIAALAPQTCAGPNVSSPTQKGRALAGRQVPLRPRLLMGLAKR